MKSQGLPLNFIILAVLAVLILILIVMFVTQGFRTDAVSVQSAVNTCESRCLNEMRQATNEDSDDYSNDDSPFCGIAQDVSGYEDSVRCDELTSCRVTFKDGTSCTLNCDEDGTSSCA